VGSSPLPGFGFGKYGVDVVHGARPNCAGTIRKLSCAFHEPKCLTLRCYEGFSLQPYALDAPHYARPAAFGDRFRLAGLDAVSIATERFGSAGCSGG
jgi:hypothetical protein